MEVAELREVKAERAAASRKRQSKKNTKERQRRLAEKERDMRIAERRKSKQHHNVAGTGSVVGRRRDAHAQTPPADKKKDKRWKKELARAPELLKKLREGQARIDALTAKIRHASLGK